jgi:diaminopimelate epimerase
VSGTTEFWKYEGTANDFVVLESGDPDADLDPGLVAKLCDRHRGIGGDGVLLVTPASDGSDARMVVRNADGSRPEMCGNGVRCVALHVALRRARPVGSTLLTVQTDAGPRTCRIELDGDAPEGWVTVDMGTIRVGETVTVPHPRHAGLEGTGQDGPGRERRDVALVSVDAGNPHAVSFEGLGDDDVDTLGAALQASVWWPKGVNLERVVLQPRAPGALLAAGVTVYERGVGRTLACGTGACAVAAAIVARGLAQPGDKLAIVLPGGPLEIVLDESGRASMRGPARHVFQGHVTLPRAS